MIGKLSDSMACLGSAMTPSLDEEVHPDWMVMPDSAKPQPCDISFPWLKYDVSSCILSDTPPNSLAGNQLLIRPAFVKLPSISSSPQTLHFLLFPRGTPGTNISLALVSCGSSISNMNVGAVWDPQNATWLAFDEKKVMFSGTVSKDAPDKIQVVFMAG